MNGKTNAISTSSPVPVVPYDETFAGSYTITASNPSLSIPAVQGKIYAINATTFNSWQVNNISITGATVKKQNRFNMSTSGQGTGMHTLAMLVEATADRMVITPKSTFPPEGTTGTFMYTALSVL